MRRRRRSPTQEHEPGLSVLVDKDLEPDMILVQTFITHLLTPGPGAAGVQLCFRSPLTSMAAEVSPPTCPLGGRGTLVLVEILQFIPRKSQNRNLGKHRVPLQTLGPVAKDLFSSHRVYF